MKRMSKTFLIISAVLLVIGIVLMITGSVMAKKQGIQLFQEKTNGKYLYTVDLTGKEITKISIDATDTDILLQTGEEKEYIEFVNFNENYYSLSTTSRIVKFEEHISLKSLFSFWDGNFKFKGMRSFFNLLGSPNGQKEVIIHLKDTSSISSFEFTITDGDINVQNTESNTDYKIAMNSGNVFLSNVKTDSKVTINGNSCNVTFDNCVIKLFESDIASAVMKGGISGVHTFDFTGKNGSLNVDLEADSKIADVSITSERTFTYNSETYDGSYANNDSTADLPSDCSEIHISGGEMELSVNVSTLQITEEGSE